MTYSNVNPLRPSAVTGATKPATQYIHALKRLDIWPSLLPFDCYSVNKVVSVIQKVPDSLGHMCTELKISKCRFRDGVNKVIRAACMLGDKMRGVTLEAASKANTEEDEESNPS
jgi:hypothetical protein